MRVVRAFAEAAVVALAFGFTILLIGLPVVLSVRLAHESLSWLARLGGEMGPVADAVVSIASVVGGIALAAVLVRGLVGFFRWRRALRGDSRSSDTATEPAHPRQLRTAEP